MDGPREQLEAGARRLSGFALPSFPPIPSLLIGIFRPAVHMVAGGCQLLLHSRVSFSDTQGQADFFCQLQFPNPGGEFRLAVRIGCPLLDQWAVPRARLIAPTCSPRGGRTPAGGTRVAGVVPKARERTP